MSLKGQGTNEFERTDEFEDPLVMGEGFMRLAPSNLCVGCACAYICTV